MYTTEPGAATSISEGTGSTECAECAAECASVLGMLTTVDSTNRANTIRSMNESCLLY